MVVYCILTGLVVYYLALWIWYRHADNHTPTDKANNAPLPQSQVSDYTLIGESRYKGGLIGTTADKSGHLPKAAENDTIFAPQVDEQPKESTSAIMPDADEIPDYEHDEPDYEDEEIAGYMGDDDTGRATGVSFDELGEACARQTPTPPPKRNSGKPPERWQALRERTSTMRWWRTSTAGWQRWLNCWDATKRNWLRLLLPELAT